MICPNHLLYNFEKNEICEKCLTGSYVHCVKNKCIHHSRVKSIIGVLEARLYALLGTYKKVDLYITPSHFLENKLLSARGFYQGKTKTIHNFIDKQKFTRENTECDGYIAFAGRLSKEKGITLLAETAKLLPDETFIVAGEGPERYVLEQIDNITLAGFLSGDKLIDFISNAKVFVVSSLWYENCPLSILEAQCLGVPVVTMNHGGMAELIEDGVTGALVDEPSPKAMAETLRKILENESYYQTLKENCEKKKQELLNVKEYADVLIKEYEKLIAR
jgi:glycosyltransferase involved in cell wall biosynthesis